MTERIQTKNRVTCNVADIALPLLTIPLIANPRDVGEGGESIDRVHLTHQRVVNVPTAIDLCHAYPNLRVVEVSASHQRLFGPTVKTIFDANDVSVEIARVRQVPFYDREGEKYRKKRKAYEKMKTSKEKGAAYDAMREKGLFEAEVARLRFEEGLSSFEIAERLEKTFAFVQRNLAVFTCWMGFPSEDKTVHAGVRDLERRLQKSGDK